ncbi:hypothetical protein [Streptomyces sp. Ag109_O5-1]|uniref:hypothetical protein n=1 Tax=Streptomyces sp. Ag109_O5-1 TaxID=1938851 RepID=UPI0037D9EC9F
MLKDRSGRGHGRLGKEAAVSGSSLHRYCSGLPGPRCRPRSRRRSSAADSGTAPWPGSAGTAAP